MSQLDVIFTPAEYQALPQRNLAGTVCVVFDVLRATSTMLTALANGATAILPVAEIDEALLARQQHPDALLGGERDGVRILRAHTGSIDFDLGNSPREFTPDKVGGKTIVMTTTNGTRALQACSGAHKTVIGTFLGLNALAEWIHREPPRTLLLVCSGTRESAAYEDALAAGALANLIWDRYEPGAPSDSAAIARQLYLSAGPDLIRAMQSSSNGRRLLEHPDLRDDVAFCLQLNTIDFVAGLKADGRIGRFY